MDSLVAGNSGIASPIDPPTQGPAPTPVTITLADYRRAMRINLFRRPRNLVKPMVVVVLASLAILWVTGALWLESALTVVLLGPLLMAVVVPLKLHVLAKRLYAQQVELRMPITFTWDDRQVTVTTERSTSSTPWTDYLRVLQDDELVLLYLNDLLFQIVPKRAFDADELDAFLARAEAVGEG